MDVSEDAAIEKRTVTESGEIKKVNHKIRASEERQNTE